jgi:pimeloyl-ACP methyl ester carboxylesterase
VRIQNGDIQLNVEVDGPDSGAPIVLLHGIISSSATWEWLLPLLTVNHRAIRLDFRGHGTSDRAPGAYQLADYLSDAVAVCEQVAGAPAAVIGHSLGGMTAAALAQTRPELVTGVFLEDPPIGFGAGADRPTGDGNALLAGFALMRQSIPPMQESGMTVQTLTALMNIAPTPAGRSFGEEIFPDGIRTMAQGMLAVDPTVLDVVLSGSFSPIYDPHRRLEMPVTVIAADPAFPDAVTRPDDLADVAAATPHAKTHTMEGSGHLIHDTKSARESYQHFVIEFLESLPR